MRLTRSEKIWCSVYAGIALVALIATWSQNLAFLRRPESGDAWSFFRALYANHAAASITNDLLLFALAGWIFMVREARRLQMRHVWVYILLSVLIGVSVLFPLFLIARQVALSRERAQTSALERTPTPGSSP